MAETKNRGALKAALLLIFILAAVGLFRFTPAGDYLNPGFIRQWVVGFGPLAPVVFIVIYALGISLLLPATLFTGIGAVLFGTYWGFLYNITGAMLGAAGGFLIGRYLGRDFAASLIGDRLRKYDENLAAHGFATTLYLRLIFFPFTPLNFGMGLTGVGFGAFLAGTLLGIIAGGFALTFFFATLAEVWASGDLLMLLNSKSLLAAALFITSFFIPMGVKRLKPAQNAA